MNIYNLMYEKTGPRHWWPAETSFEVIVGAILTQFVSWKNVVTAINNLKAENLLNVESICSTGDNELEELIRCTRFYKQKAKKLKAFCTHLRDRYDGDLDRFFDKDTSELRKELLGLFGIGEETADCIILYAAEKPIFVVDSYTRRIYGRLGFFSEDVTYGEMQKFFTENLPCDTMLFNEYHAQIDGVGNRFCSGKNPRCGDCPLTGICKFESKIKMVK